MPSSRGFWQDERAMRAMLLRTLGPVREGAPPLELVDRAPPRPGSGQLLLRVSVCGVCHTELDEIEGRTPPPRLPVVPGHQAVGRVDAVGPGVRDLRAGDRVGVPWIFSACGRCRYCREGNENLCPFFVATGRDIDGGYAEFMTVPAPFALPIREAATAAEAAQPRWAG